MTTQKMEKRLKKIKAIQKAPLFLKIGVPFGNKIKKSGRKVTLSTRIILSTTSDEVSLFT